jgi:hypothetical protein
LYQNVDTALFDGCSFVASGTVYYSLSTNNLTFRDCDFVGAASISGANQSDHGAFGYTYVRGLHIEGCFFNVTGSDPIPLQLGAVRGASVVDSWFYRCSGMAVNINSGKSPVSTVPRDIKIEGCFFVENNQGALTAQSHPAILLTTASTSGLTINDSRFYDDQDTPTQLYPMVFDHGSATTWSDVRITNSCLSAYSGATSYRLNNSATLDSSCSFANNFQFTAPATTGLCRWYANTPVQPQGVASITVTGSPFVYTAGRTPEAVYIRAGTVSDIAKNSTTIFAASPATVYLEPGESVVVTYSSAPTMTRDRK